MNYYIQGDAANADKIKAAFEEKGCTLYRLASKCDSEDLIYYSLNGIVRGIKKDNLYLFEAHPGYKELELPVEPKFKAEDRIVSKSDRSTIYRIIDLHEERREYIVEIEHKDYHESCPWIAFEDQDDYELAPKPHYDVGNFHVGMPVLVREYDTCHWQWVLYSHFNGVGLFFAAGKTWRQCIPYNDDTKHLLGTTDICPEEYINW